MIYRLLMFAVSITLCVLSEGFFQVAWAFLAGMWAILLMKSIQEEFFP